MHCNYDAKGNKYIFQKSNYITAVEEYILHTIPFENVHCFHVVSREELRNMTFDFALEL